MYLEHSERYKQDEYSRKIKRKRLEKEVYTDINEVMIPEREYQRPSTKRLLSKISYQNRTGRRALRHILSLISFLISVLIGILLYFNIAAGHDFRIVDFLALPVAMLTGVFGFLVLMALVYRNC